MTYPGFTVDELRAAPFEHRYLRQSQLLFQRLRHQPAKGVVKQSEHEFDLRMHSRKINKVVDDPVAVRCSGDALHVAIIQDSLRQGCPPRREQLCGRCGNEIHGEKAKLRSTFDFRA